MSSDPQNLSRRGFARAAATAALVPVIAPLAACAGGGAEPAPAPNPAPATGANPTAPSAPPQRQNEQQRDPVAEELMEVLRVRYRDRLSGEQWEEVRKGIEGNLRVAKTLHDFRIPTATEPASVFRAYRGGAR
jgi:pyruvate/2-oxoglutarate dehydrogenase complex dihydrolipoamide acyltransferase (E2) component